MSNFDKLHQKNLDDLDRLKDFMQEVIDDVKLRGMTPEDASAKLDSFFYASTPAREPSVFDDADAWEPIPERKAPAPVNKEEECIECGDTKTLEFFIGKDGAKVPIPDELRHEYPCPHCPEPADLADRVEDLKRKLFKEPECAECGGKKIVEIQKLARDCVSSTGMEFWREPCPTCSPAPPKGEG